MWRDGEPVSAVTRRSFATLAKAVFVLWVEQMPDLNFSKILCWRWSWRWPWRWNMASLERLVYDRSNQRTKGRALCFHQSSRKGVEGASGGFHPFDDVFQKVAKGPRDTNLWVGSGTRRGGRFKIFKMYFLFLPKHHDHKSFYFPHSPQSKWIMTLWSVKQQIKYHCLQLAILNNDCSHECCRSLWPMLMASAVFSTQSKFSILPAAITGSLSS